MKRIFSATIFICFYSFTFAQSVSTGWGDLNKNEKKMSLYTTFGSLDGGLYSLFTSFKPGHVFIEKYTGNAKVVFNKELIIPTPSGLSSDVKFELTKVLYIKNVIYLFTSFYNKNTDTRYLFANTVSKDGVINKDLTKLDEVKDLKKYEGSYHIIPSDDSSKICIYNYGAYEKNEREKIFMHVIDLQLKDVWNKRFELPYLDKVFGIREIKIDNFGNAVVSGEVDLKGEEAKGKADYKFVLISYLWNTGETKEYNVDLGDKYMNNFYFTFDKDNNIKAAGFYSLKGNTEWLNGYFYLNIDSKTQSVTNKVAKDFDANFIKNFPKKKDLINVSVQQLFIADNGTLNIIAEQNYSYTIKTTSTSGGMTTTYTTTHYVSNNIVVINLKADGTYNWASVISKKQDLANTSYGIYSVIMPYKNSIFFAYNDVIGNTKITDEAQLKRFVRYGKTEMVLCKIDEKGKFTKQVITAPDPKTAKKTFMVPEYAVKLSPENYVFTCYTIGKKDYRYGIFSIK